MNVSAGIVRIGRVTRSCSVGGSGAHPTARLSAKTGDGTTARLGGIVTDPTMATRRKTAERTNPNRILDPHRDLLPGPEFETVPEDIRQTEARESREQIARVREVHDREARRRRRGRGAGGGRGGGGEAAR